jgi:hypothetical protein
MPYPIPEVTHLCAWWAIHRMEIELIRGSQTGLDSPPHTIAALEIIRYAYGISENGSLTSDSMGHTETVWRLPMEDAFVSGYERYHCPTLDPFTQVSPNPLSTHIPFYVLHSPRMDDISHPVILQL